MNLVLAPQPAKRARDKLTHAEWGQQLTEAEFLQREQRLRAHPWSNENMRTWLLRDDAGEVHASCETFRMDSVLTVAGEPRRGVSFGVASVFTEPAKRGLGHATRMMNDLCARFLHDPRKVHAVILFSDVGAKIYQRSGFVARPSAERSFTAGAGDQGEPSEGVDALITEKELSDALASMQPPAAPFVIWPTALQLDWHLERERIYSELLKRPRPLACGAKVGGSTLLWCGNLKEDRLQTLLLEGKKREEVEALFACARRVASRAGLATVSHWETPLPFEWEGGERREREGGLSMIRPLAEGVRAGDWTVIPRALWI